MSSALHRSLAVVALMFGLAVAVQGSNERPGATAQPYLSDLAPKDSPFLPPPFELTGVSLAADGTRVCIYAEKDQRSRWIAVGAAADGIKVVSYDPDRQQAVISVGGETRELELQHGVAAAQTLNPVPDGPSPPVAVASVSTAADAPDSTPAAGAPAAESSSQRDDRMLVSDLLDISIQQRQAYAKAQQAPAVPAAATK